jgi:hypothetical protein
MLTDLEKAHLWTNKIIRGVMTRIITHISIYSGEASPQYWQGWPPANNSLLNIGYRYNIRFLEIPRGISPRYPLE